MTELLSPQKTTPMMAQWHACKQGAEQAILFFRMGDFYEAFYDDAELLAKELGLTLTKRQGIPMAGVPVHTCEGYVDKLVAKGYRVAVAEQMEDPKATKGIVRREVVRVVTPGTLLESSLLKDKSNNFFASLTIEGSVLGLAFMDLSTGEFRAVEFSDPAALSNELYRLRPTELLVSRKFERKHGTLLTELKKSFSFLVNEAEDWQYEWQSTATFLLEHFQVKTLDGFGLKGMSAAIQSAGALLRFLQDDLCLPIQQIRQLGSYSVSTYMSLDQTSQRNLELTESQQDGSRRNTLLDVLDRTQTPMGGRLMVHWVKQPLLCCEEIQLRQGAVEAFFQHQGTLEQSREFLGHVRDLERLMMKVASAYASPRDFSTLRFSLLPLPQLKQVLHGLPSGKVQTLLHELIDFTELTDLIGRALVDEPPARLSDGGVFRQGYQAELDELLSLKKNGKEWLDAYQQRIREEFDIKTLKVGYNRVFGYYIDVSKTQASRMPEHFIRRQTLTNSERFISPELKDYEEKILSAEERISTLENQLFVELRDKVATYTEAVLKVARALAELDTLGSLAYAAREHDYCLPTVDDSDRIEIVEGRHPVIESVNLSERFIPNDCSLDGESQRLQLITGPNMAGKSTYIRQVALITIMAQMGSFVPAKQAHVGIVDKVFTRIGASDDLSRGQSTFMVEMTETANILHNATPRSLVILDEIGRGTSTYDGISIAWAVAEYLLSAKDRCAKTLFATHYWELTRLDGLVHGAKNYHVAVRECEDQIVFLRKIVAGSTDKSYGIHVAQLAGLPEEVIKRARSILSHLEDEERGDKVFDPPPQTQRTVMGVPCKGEEEIQFVMFEPATKKRKARPSKVEADPRATPLLERLAGVDLDDLSPRKAHSLLAELQNEAKKAMAK